VLGHNGWAHFIGNMSYILLLGPMLEEKYGGAKILEVIGITALVTGIVNFIFFPSVALCGASGVVFAFILLVSFTNVREGEIPVSVILVALIFIGQQVYEGLFVQDNVSNLSHILGGIVGAVVGYRLNVGKGRLRKNSAAFCRAGRPSAVLFKMNGGNAVEQILELGQFFFLFQKQNGHRFVKRHGRDDIEQVEEEFVPHGIPCQRASHQEHEQETQQPCDNKVHGCPVSLSGFIDFALQFDDQVLFQDVGHLRLRIRPEIVELQRQIHLVFPWSQAEDRPDLVQYLGADQRRIGETGAVDPILRTVILHNNLRGFLLFVDFEKLAFNTVPFFQLFRFHSFAVKQGLSGPAFSFLTGCRFPAAGICFRPHQSHFFFLK
jgi:membrane associated rhomboid family serine protease